MKKRTNETVATLERERETLYSTWNLSTRPHTHTRKSYRIIKREEKNTSEIIELKGLNLKLNNSE